jgi:hypothetical protein
MKLHFNAYVLLFLVPVVALQHPIDLSQRKRTIAALKSMSPASIFDFESNRRTFLGTTLSGVASTVTIMALPSDPAVAMPMVSTEEFNTIIRDSARSIETVEFSGPKSETVVVVLVDGTNFGISDVIESSTDPRSPLKIAAMCKANQIPYRFLNIESMLNATPRKKKMYTNARVLQAAEKQKEKEIRMQQDEALRLEELREMQLPN